MSRTTSFHLSLDGRGSYGKPNTGCSQEELDFLSAAEYNDFKRCRRLLENHPQLNVDVLDPLGRSALRLAVRNENNEVRIPLYCT